MPFITTAVLAIADAAAWLVSHRRELVHHTLTEDECEAAGVAFGSTERAVHIHPMVGASAWRLDAWLDGTEREGCLNIDALGHHIEVFYRRRMQASVAMG